MPDDPMPPRTSRELRRFGLTIGAAFLVLAALALWRGRAGMAFVLAAPGTVLTVLAAVAPGLLRLVERGWMAASLALSRVTTPVIMAILYFGVLTPLALVMRRRGRTALDRPRDGSSFWVDRPPDARRSDLRRQF